VKSLIVAFAVLSDVAACHFTPASKTVKQSADIKKVTQAAAVLVSPILL